MIVRLVKMTFKDSEIDNFKSIFKITQPKIAEMKGCLKVDLRQDINQPEIFFTISHWENEDGLENYRKSQLFINTWKQVKPLFITKAEAWSLT